MSTIPPTYIKESMVNENIEGYQGETKNNPSAENSDEFSFFDFLDMINPLQHIPLVNIAYRAITKDSIKPISEIIGGAVFGGAVGAAGGLVNTVVREETGQDIAGNIFSMTLGTHKKPLVSSAYNLEKERTAYNDLPLALLAFAEKPLLTNEEKNDYV